MLTLSDSENNLHFILILQGLIRHRDKGGRGEKREMVTRIKTKLKLQEEEQETKRKLEFKFILLIIKRIINNTA